MIQKTHYATFGADHQPPRAWRTLPDGARAGRRGRALSIEAQLVRAMREAVAPFVAYRRAMGQHAWGVQVEDDA